MLKVNRSKGLGENDPDMMWLTTMNPETRRLIKVEPEDVHHDGNHVQPVLRTWRWRISRNIFH